MPPPTLHGRRGVGMAGVTVATASFRWASCALMTSSSVARGARGCTVRRAACRSWSYGPFIVSDRAQASRRAPHQWYAHRRLVSNPATPGEGGGQIDLPLWRRKLVLCSAMTPGSSRSATTLLPDIDQYERSYVRRGASPTARSSARAVPKDPNRSFCPLRERFRRTE